MGREGREGVDVVPHGTKGGERGGGKRGRDRKMEREEGGARE